MKCECNEKLNNKSSKISLEFQKTFMEEIMVDGKIWITLYKCKKCGTYWEERDNDSRFGVHVKFFHVEESYVKDNWFNR